MSPTSNHTSNQIVTTQLDANDKKIRIMEERLNMYEKVIQDLLKSKLAKNTVIEATKTNGTSRAILDELI